MKKYLIAGAMAALIAPAVNAATISETDSIAIQATDWSETMTFNQFDPALGTLTSVMFDLSGLVEGSARAENLGSAAVNAGLNLEAEISASTAGFGSLLGFVIPAVSQSVPLAAFDGTVDFGGPSGVTLLGLSGTDSDSQTFTAALAPFIGTGTLNVDVVADASSSASGGGNIITQFLTDASADGLLTYNYEPVTTTVIPLPAAAWLLLAGIGTLFAFRRRTHA